MTAVTAGSDPRMQEWHWCPWCDDREGQHPERIVTFAIGDALIITCPVHGEQQHDSNAEDFCWCEK